jgi:hypothetical protein
MEQTDRDRQQIAWDTQVNETVSDFRYPAHLYAEHRRLFSEIYPDAPLRPEYNTSADAYFTGVFGESPQLIDELLQHAQGGNALVIGASGYAFLTALMNDAKQVDIVDKEPSQIAWNYAIGILVAMTPKEDLLRVLEDFRRTAYDIRRFDSVHMPQERMVLVRQLPTFFNKLHVPREYRSMITQYFSYESFNFDKDMTDGGIWELFLSKYDSVRNGIARRRFSMHLEDIVPLLKKRPKTYQAIYTSNALQYSGLSVSASAEILGGALVMGGVGNISWLSGFEHRDIVSDRISSNTKIIDRKGRRKDSSENWIVIEKE